MLVARVRVVVATTDVLCAAAPTTYDLLNSWKKNRDRAGRQEDLAPSPPLPAAGIRRHGDP